MNLREQRAAAIKAARDVIEHAKAEGRELSDEDQTAIDGHMDEVKNLDVQIKSAALVKSVMDLGGTDNEPDPEQPVKAGSLGEHFASHVKADGLSRLKAIGGYTVSAPEFVPAKAATDPQLTTGAVWGPVLTQVDRTIVHGFRPGPVVADLLSSGSLSGNAVTYFVEGAVEGAFTTVAEGGQKPQLHVVDPTAVTDALKKIAAWFDMSDEMTEDLDFYVSEINGRATYLLAMFEEAQLLNGLGTGTTVRGLLNRSGIQTEVSAAGGAGGDDGPKAIFRAMTKIQTATGLSADGVIVNPADYQLMRLMVDGNKQYIAGGPFAGQYGVGGVPEQPPLWGLRTVVSSAVAAGTAVVGSFKAAATVYRKGGVRVEATNSDAGKFTSNIITTRIEERLALACRMPAAIVKVTFTP
jgi:HK97 family phage major capsid protein